MQFFPNPMKEGNTMKTFALIGTYSSGYGPKEVSFRSLRMRAR